MAADPEATNPPAGHEGPRQQRRRGPLPEATTPPAGHEGSPTRASTVVGDELQGLGAVLTQRERQVLQYLITGLSNKAIARELQIAEATVKLHVKNLFSKGRVANWGQAAFRGIDVQAAFRAIGLTHTSPTDDDYETGYELGKVERVFQDIDVVLARLENGIAAECAAMDALLGRLTSKAA